MRIGSCPDVVTSEHPESWAARVESFQRICVIGRARFALAVAGGPLARGHSAAWKIMQNSRSLSEKMPGQRFLMASLT